MAETWFQHKHRKVFHNLTLLQRFEKLAENNREKLASKNILNLFAFLRGIEPRWRRVPGILTGMEPIRGDYKAHVISLFDPYLKERTQWSLEAAQLRRQLSDLDNLPWDSPSPRAMRKRQEEMSTISSSLTMLDSKLAGLPPRNTFQPEELFHFETNEELEQSGIITDIHEVYPRFTEKGLRIYKTSDEMFYYVKGQLRHVNDEKSIEALQTEVWSRMKAVYV